MNEKNILKLKAYQAMINKELEELESCAPSRLSEAQKYSLTAGGKRIRPVLTLAFCELFGGKIEAALPYAIAVEMIHTASLIHDDLPSIDNDVLRRGKPTCHVVFGEALALLAADGLFMDAFGRAAANPHVTPELTAEAIKKLSFATGSRGLVGGELLDVLGEGSDLSQVELDTVHSMKTGALIRVSCELGALAAGVFSDEEKMTDAVTYAESIGLAFQIVDDVLDAKGTVEKLGKTPGKDEGANKTTYLTFYTESEAIAMAENLTDRARKAISRYVGSDFLSELADTLVKRDH